LFNHATRSPNATEPVGPVRFWELLCQVEKLRQLAQGGDTDSAFLDFWLAVAPAARTLRSLTTVFGQMVAPCEALLPRPRTDTPIDADREC